MKTKMIEFIFGKKVNKRFYRMFLVLITLILSVILFLNINFGYDQTKGGFYFNWVQAAKIEVKK